MKRQGLLVTINELKDLIKQLEQEVKENEDKYGVSGYGTKFQINIINRTGNSDDWEIEK